MLSLLSRHSLPVLRQSRSSLFSPLSVSSRFMSTDGKTIDKHMHERHEVIENAHFNKKDKELLTQLLEKMKRHVEPTVDEHDIDRMALVKIFEKHNVKVGEAAISDLLKWRRGKIN